MLKKSFFHSQIENGGTTEMKSHNFQRILDELIEN